MDWTRSGFAHVVVVHAQEKTERFGGGIFKEWVRDYRGEDGFSGVLELQGCPSSSRATVAVGYGFLLKRNVSCAVCSTAVTVKTNFVS